MDMDSASGNETPARWLDLYGDYLYSLAFTKVSHRETAEDLVQETLVAAIQALGSFRQQSSVKTWLTSILTHKIIDHYRKRDVLKNTVEYLAGTEDDFTEHFFEKDNGHWLDATAPEPWHEGADATIDQQEFQQVMQRCIQKMPPRLIPVFIARFLEDQDADSICKDHALSSSNYWVILHRAKVLIRSCLEKNWFLR